MNQSHWKISQNFYKEDPDSYDIIEAMQKRIISLELRQLQLEGIVFALEKKSK